MEFASIVNWYCNKPIDILEWSMCGGGRLERRCGLPQSELTNTLKLYFASFLTRWLHPSTTVLQPGAKRQRSDKTRHDRACGV